MKHVILGLQEPNLNEKLERDTSSFISDYTLQNTNNLDKIKGYFKPDTLVLSANLKMQPTLVDKLIAFRQDPATESVDLIVFTGGVPVSDVAMVNAIGRLIDAGIYPVLDTATAKAVIKYVSAAPTLGSDLQEFYNRYKKRKEEEQEAKKQSQRPESKPESVKHTVKFNSEKKQSAKAIGFLEARHGSGKKFTLSNFVASLAVNNPDKKIAVIDLDPTDAYLGEYFGISEEDAGLKNVISAIHSYSTKKRLKDFSGDEKDKLRKRTVKILEKGAIPVAGIHNAFAITHTEKDAEKIGSLARNEIGDLLELIQDKWDVAVFNLDYSALEDNALKEVFNHLDLIYSVITMSKYDVNANLKLKQLYNDNKAFNKVHYVVNKYEDSNYTEVTTPLNFNLDLLADYDFNVTNILPSIEPNILFNESFSGMLLANEHSKETKYPRTSFSLLVRDAGYQDGLD